jgi:hypothetical protein
MLDFNDAKPQRDTIPDGTIATVCMKIRPGGAGEGGWLCRAKDGNSEHLNCEFVVLDGEYAKRKFWTLLTVDGITEGHAEAVRINRSRLLAMLESARGIHPDDKSDAAKEARRTASYGDFDGLTFMARIGVEPAQNGYKAKNRLDRVITPDEKAWLPVTQDPKPAATPTLAASTSAPTKIERPSWATKAS